MTVASREEVRKALPLPAYTADQVAELLTLKRRTVLDHAQAGTLPAIRVGKLYRFPRPVIDALVNGEALEPRHDAAG